MKISCFSIYSMSTLEILMWFCLVGRKLTIRVNRAATQAQEVLSILHSNWMHRYGLITNYTGLIVILHKISVSIEFS